jgi:hypothetical protein
LSSEFLRKALDEADEEEVCALFFRGKRGYHPLLADHKTSGQLLGIFRYVRKNVPNPQVGSTSNPSGRKEVS